MPFTCVSAVSLQHQLSSGLTEGTSSCPCSTRLCDGVGPQTHTRLRRRRSALPMTDTELKLMARAAIMGDSSQPVSGYSTPAAMGMPSVLYRRANRKFVSCWPR